MLASQKSAFREHFQAWDADGSGYLDRTEFGRILSSCGMSNRTLDRVFKCIDVDGNGLIEREEFIEWLDPINHATKTDSSEAAKRVRNCILLANFSPTPPSKLTTPIRNLRARFPEACDSDLKRALQKSQGHGGRAIQVLEEDAVKVKLQQFQHQVSRRHSSQTPTARRPDTEEFPRRPSLPSLIVPGQKQERDAPMSRGSSRRSSKSSTSSASFLETDEDEELAAREEFLFGDIVVLHNFPSSMKLNRSRGIVRGWCEQARRYEVEIPGTHGVIRVAQNNLRRGKRVKKQDMKDMQAEVGATTK
eukprot:TRINITY_DN24590_c0_g1_i2.p1 TRINITY_DN24590_c0_g1~~TRINITY_DN24590_c0_g1_i2.p1  ORF type:complete len:336 (+),score=41.81 TRINITY_DN24590_c0_g1_i2:96-1010(+)